MKAVRNNHRVQYKEHVNERDHTTQTQEPINGIKCSYQGVKRQHLHMTGFHHLCHESLLVDYLTYCDLVGKPEGARPTGRSQRILLKWILEKDDRVLWTRLENLLGIIFAVIPDVVAVF
jgi:hypothetical protein